jgi:MFS family permease
MDSIPDAVPQPIRNEKDILTRVPISPPLFQEKTKFGAPGRRTGSIITIIGSACANLSDGFQQGLASSTNVIFNHLMGTKVYTSAVQTRMSNSLLVGSVIGILVFGYLADRFSRKGGSKFVLFCCKVNDR